MYFILQIKAEQCLESVLHNSSAPKNIYDQKQKKKFKNHSAKTKKYSATVIQSG